MTPELRKYYENRLEMMGSPAWKDLMEDVDKMLKAADTLSGATIGNLQYKQGEINIMRWLLSLKQTSDEVYSQLKDDL